MKPDFKRLAAEVTARHGIRVDPDDPMMAIVTLNCLMLEAAAAEVEEGFRRALGDFETAIERLHVRAGEAVADEVRQCVATMRTQPHSDRSTRGIRAAALGQTADEPPPPDSRLRRSVSTLFFGLVSFSAGLGVGLWSS
jgi:hypothetical protein